MMSSSSASSCIHRSGRHVTTPRGVLLTAAAHTPAGVRRRRLPSAADGCRAGLHSCARQPRAVATAALLALSRRAQLLAGVRPAAPQSGQRVRNPPQAVLGRRKAVGEARALTITADELPGRPLLRPSTSTERRVSERLVGRREGRSGSEKQRGITSVCCMAAAPQRPPGGGRHDLRGAVEVVPCSPHKCPLNWVPRQSASCKGVHSANGHIVCTALLSSAVANPSLRTVHQAGTLYGAGAGAGVQWLHAVPPPSTLVKEQALKRKGAKLRRGRQQV